MYTNNWEIRVQRIASTIIYIYRITTCREVVKFENDNIRISILAYQKQNVFAIRKNYKNAIGQ